MVKTKSIAGKIIPAMATTTAFIVGVVLGELPKVVQGFKNLALYKNLNGNLATNYYVRVKPASAPQITGADNDPQFGSATVAIPDKFSEWDKIDISGPMTVGEFVKYIKNTYKVRVTMVYANKQQIYTSYDREYCETVLDMGVEARLAEVREKPVGENIKTLQLTIDGWFMQDITGDGGKVLTQIKCAALMPPFRYKVVKPTKTLSK